MRRTRLPFLALCLVVAALPLLPVPPLWIIHMNFIGLSAITCLGLVLLTGVAGLTSFGQAAFVGLGAYATAYCSTALGLSPWLGLVVALALTVSVALLLAAVTLRMSGHYLPLATLAWALALYYLMSNLDFLGKYDGILDIPALSIAGWKVTGARGYYGVIWIAALASAAATVRLLDSRTGRAIRSLSGGTAMAEAMGISTYRYKVLTFVLAAMLAGLSGWLFAHFQRTVNPSPFSATKGIEYLFMTVLGGVGSVWGAFTGAAVVRLLEDQLQVLLPRLLGNNGNFELILFGIVLVAVLKYAPQGLWSYVLRLARRWWPEQPRVHDWHDARALDVRSKPAAGEKLLEVQGLSKRFGGLLAVNDVSFIVNAGEIVALIGPNGAGKSTTFNLISGVAVPTSGSVVFRGDAVGGLPSREVARRGMSRTFQHVKMLPGMTVLENVALGGHVRSRKGALRAMLRLDRDEERQLFREAACQLERVGLGQLMDTLAGNLSLGQARLLEIARALCADPLLLLLDEPAAGLRHKEKEALAACLAQLKQEGMSILLVEHDMDFVMSLAERIVVMEFGNKLIEGSPEEIQASPVVRAAYLGTEH
ncbi:MAG: branched-chain amino acid ABC transporter ATP-binding protein/permease [Rubrivivax sp.]|nr:MAG: branched-chain amino acid ABC transporter ATP-binding protein/permease [Rubrivivax sp.]